MLRCLFVGPYFFGQLILLLLPLQKWISDSPQLWTQLCCPHKIEWHHNACKMPLYTSKVANSILANTAEVLLSLAASVLTISTVYFRPLQFGTRRIAVIVLLRQQVAARAENSVLRHQTHQRSDLLPTIPFS